MLTRLAALCLVCIAGALLVVVVARLIRDRPAAALRDVLAFVLLMTAWWSTARQRSRLSLTV